MTQNPDRISVNYEERNIIVPVRVEEGIARAAIADAIPVRLTGSREDGGALIDTETGEPIVKLAGANEDEYERAA